MLLHDVQARLRIALTTTLTNEWGLFTPATGTSHPSARSIAFHVGWHLGPMFDESWDVDCDYERSGAAPEPSLAFGPGALRAPDLIVHRRGRLGPEDNLLLVSLTADFASHQAETPDFDTVRSVQLRYGYRYAVWVDLQLRDDGPEGRVRPRWHWGTLDEGPVRAEPEAVYTTEELRSITQAIQALYLG
ncbi:hypothetical protein Xcel_0973 [Xylanimonas cellulosilytica DSM 15894]|uniref:Uncharacterized protein n=1 Tax=Xylanimonas cellulosilytica (strain DSM 15894 / JCM 12276 / CECT 5975 / KCTC 9989 / LMG 20990 / NBRC 107835 / XIL07) TaxID=446471 RepID=D1BYS9_XYLCX|nr:hypothetical protein [Xylanimonas cellulosilytica]ACZ30004.1 hypothetical protein Xcel_0973 [Xylanimonas cellulosilytica DSM 15894]